MALPRLTRRTPTFEIWGWQDLWNLGMDGAQDQGDPTVVMCKLPSPLHATNFYLPAMCRGRSATGTPSTTSSSTRAPTLIHLAASFSTHPTSVQASQYGSHPARSLERSITKADHFHDHHTPWQRWEVSTVALCISDTHSSTSSSAHGEKGRNLQHGPVEEISRTSMFRSRQHRCANSQTLFVSWREQREWLGWSRSGGSHLDRGITAARCLQHVWDGCRWWTWLL